MSYLGQGTDANVGQKEPLLSIKKDERIGRSSGGGQRERLPPVKDPEPAALHRPSPRTEGIKSYAEEGSCAKLQ